MRSGSFSTKSMYVTYYRIIRWVIEEENKFKRKQKDSNINP